MNKCGNGGLTYLLKCDIIIIVNEKKKEGKNNERFRTSKK